MARSVAFKPSSPRRIEQTPRHRRHQGGLLMTRCSAEGRAIDPPAPAFERSSNRGHGQVTPVGLTAIGTATRLPPVWNSRDAIPTILKVSPRSGRLFFHSLHFERYFSKSGTKFQPVRLCFHVPSHTTPVGVGFLGITPERHRTGLPGGMRSVRFPRDRAISLRSGSSSRMREAIGGRHRHFASHRPWRVAIRHSLACRARHRIVAAHPGGRYGSPDAQARETLARIRGAPIGGIPHLRQGGGMDRMKIPKYPRIGSGLDKGGNECGSATSTVSAESPAT